MNTVPFSALACPLDGEPLLREPSRWCCPQGHSFDIARQGYVNLLPAQFKRAKEPGDSKAMVTARQHFLARGHYLPIADALAQVITDFSPTAEHLRCLDAGCGEGYYLDTLAQHAEIPLELVGVDISKWAILAAAKRNAHVNWIVASNARLPIQDASLDYVFCLFGFPVYEEFARVLKPQGKLVMVDPAPTHLYEARKLLYPRLKAEQASSNTVPTGFTLVEKREIQQTFTLTSSEQIQNLLLMTPHWFRATPEKREQVLTLAELNTQLAVTINLFQQTPQRR